MSHSFIGEALPLHLFIQIIYSLVDCTECTHYFVLLCFVVATSFMVSANGPLARYVKLRVAHAPGMPGTFPPPPRATDPGMHHGTCVTHVPWCMPGSLTSGFIWSRWRGKRSRHYRRMHNPQFYVSGKRPIAVSLLLTFTHIQSNFTIVWLRDRGYAIDIFCFIAV